MLKNKDCLESMPFGAKRGTMRYFRQPSKGNSLVFNGIHSQTYKWGDGKYIFLNLDKYFFLTEKKIPPVY